MTSKTALNQEKSTQGSLHFGHIAPEFARITDEVLFDNIWERKKQLSQRERSLITIASLITQSRPDQLLFHLKKAHANGVNYDELAEVMTHLAFYAGWPSTAEAINQLEALIDQSE